MKETFCILFLAFISTILMGQIKQDDELSNKLQGKELFNEIKATVLNHYEDKLSLFQPNDSTERRNILRQLKMWNRKFWIDEYYTSPNGKIADRAQVDIQGLEEAQRMRSQKTNFRNQPSEWVNQGPFSSSEGFARIDAIKVHPTNPSILYAGSPNGGLFKSINYGENWAPISAFLPSLGIAGIAIDPTNSAIIYVLTGNRNNGDGCFTGGACFPGFSSVSKGVYKTLDAGISWNKTSDFQGLSGSVLDYSGKDLIINPTLPQRLLASTSKGVFFTWDGGISWGPCSGFDSNDNVWEISFKPGDPNTVYAVGTSNTANSGFFKKSTDGGITFSTISVPELNSSTRISMAVTIANPNKIALFAGKGGFNCFVGIFISNDSGNTFTVTNNDNSNNLFYNYIENNVETNQVWFNNCIAIDPENENNIFVGGLCVWNSTDGGYNWTQKTAYWNSPDLFNEYIHPDQHVLLYNNGTLWIGNDGGVYRSDNNAGTCNIKSNGISATQFYHFERKNKNNSIWGGTQDNGVLEHNTNGNYGEFAGGDGYDMMTDHSYNVTNGEGNDGYITINNKIYTTCSVFTICDRSVPGNNSFFGNLDMSPDDEDDLWVGYEQGLYKSTNAGSLWTQFGTYPANWCISTVKNNPNTVYVAGSSPAFSGGFRVHYAGTSFDLTPNLILQGYNSSLKITDIDVDPTNDDIVYISVGGTLATSKVFQTNDGGDSWTNLTFNLPNVPIFCIKRDALNGLYVGTSIGVFYKRNGINYWELFSNGLPNVPITEIELWIEGSTPEVWASTFGRGIWYTNQYSTCDNNLSLSGNINGNQYKEAAILLTSNQILGIGEGNNIKYNTGEKIILQDGFRAYSGSKFKTYTSGCGGQTD